jgi:hypothetical protein
VIGQDSGATLAAAWVARGRPLRLERGLDRLLDADGVPRRLAVGAWGELLIALAGAWQRRPEGWPVGVDARVEGLVRATLRFARFGGASVFSAPAARPDPALVAALRGWAERLSDPGLATVLNWWFPTPAGRRVREYAPPPLPAWACPDRPLAMLRANWTGEGDLLAIDHRGAGPECLVELVGLGSLWLGPTWASEAGSEIASGQGSRPRPLRWLSNSSADLVEWTFAQSGRRVIRTALLLRGRRVALLADQVEGLDASDAAGVSVRIALPEGVAAAWLGNGPGLVLSQRRSSRTARLIPLGLPPAAGLAGTERGTLACQEQALRVVQRAEGRRCWLPLLVSWDPLRNRQSVHWRAVTVAEKSRVCPPDTAFAARVTWGRPPGETLLVYRSLARPALRSVLGYQTSARFLVAVFTPEGNVEPIVKVD